MLDRSLVPPRYFVDRKAQHGGDLLPLARARRPTPERNSEHAAFFDLAPLRELRNREAAVMTELGDGAIHGKVPSGRVHLTQIGQVFRRELVVPAIVGAYTLYCTG
jgi:hypothetical protein